MFLQEKLNEILETEFTLQRETEKYREKSDQVCGNSRFEKKNITWLLVGLTEDF